MQIWQNKHGNSMYSIIKKADEFGLNRVFLASREFIEEIEELTKEKDKLRTNRACKTHIAENRLHKGTRK